MLDIKAKRIAVAFATGVVAVTVAAAPLFRNPQPIAIPFDGITELLAADLNGDGHDDVLVVAPGRRLVALLDNGTGPFAPPVVTPLPYSTAHPAIADLTGDGIPDVVVTDWSTATVTVMVGTGDGTFTPGTSFPTVSLPGPVAVADFNGDGKLDVAVASVDYSAATVVAVHLGDGSGGFAGPVTTQVEFRAAWSLVAAQVNLDGNADLLISGCCGTKILLGDGQGGFVMMPEPIGGASLVVADFNHDGKPDLAGAAGSTHQWFIEVDLGRGDGTFSSSTQYVAGYESGSLAGADIDSDGNVDLLAAGTDGSVVTVLRGRADGTFSPPSFYVSGPSAWKIVTGDFDRDGKIDFVTLDYNAELPALSFVRGNGDGTFATYRGFHTNSQVPVLWPGLSASGGVIADMNNDGKPDVVAVQKHDPAPLECDIGVLLNDGTGNLVGPILTDSGAEEWSAIPGVAVGDVDNDGNQDVVVLSDLPSSSYARTLLGDGAGGFGPPIVSDVTVFGLPTLGKFTGHANLDLFVAGDYQAAVYPGNGDGTFGSGVVSTVPAENVLVGDLNGDGVLDYVSSWVRDIEACMNDGSGHFACSVVTSDEVSAVALADFNGDGKLDLLLTTYTGVQTRFGNGDGTFGLPIDFSINPAEEGLPWTPPVTTADFDGDGRVDVAFGTSVYLSNGDGTFRSRERFRTNDVSFVAVADMDGSGSPDLVVTKPTADDVDVILTRTTSDPTAPTSISLTSEIPAPQYGQTVTFTATVTGGAVPLAGVVRFTIDGASFALVAADADGKARLQTAFGVGPHLVEAASYTGDENYQSSTAAAEVTVTKAQPTVAISGSPNPQGVHLTVTVVVAVTAPIAYGFAGPTGAITLRDGDTPLDVQVTGGVAHINTLALGSHLISADYAGDENFLPATGSYTQVIVPPPTVVAITPSVGPTQGGQSVTISGTDLTGATLVCLDGACAASFVVNGPTSITTTTPLHSGAGAVDVTVATVGGLGRLVGGYLYVAPGDVNADGSVNASDVFYLISYLFVGGPAPVGSGDVSGDGQVNVGDVFYLINYLFAGGPAPA